MLKITTILIMATALLCGSLSAQDGLETKKGDAKTRFSGKLTDIPIEELIRMTCDMQNIQIIYDPRKVQGTVTFLAPKDGFDVPNGAFFSLLQMSLKQYRLCLTPFGTNSDQSVKIYEIVPAMEAVTTATPIVLPEDIDKWTDTTDQFITLVVTLKHADANSVRGALQNLTSRQGGQVNPIAGVNALIIIDYTDNIRRLAKVIKAIDVPTTSEESGSMFHYYELRNADATELAKVLNEMIGNHLTDKKGDDVTKRPGLPRVSRSSSNFSRKNNEEVRAIFSADRNTNSLLVHTDFNSYHEIKALIEKLDVAPAAKSSSSTEKNNSGCAAGSGGSGFVLLALMAALAGVCYRRRKLV